MKRNITTTFLIVLIASNSYGADFRNISWGMTRSQVEKAESLKIITVIDNRMFYKTSLMELDTTLIYEFTNNSLTSAAYFFNAQHTNPQSFYIDYNKIHDLLIKKYGNPVRFEKVWKNDLFKGDVENYGSAIMSGHLDIFALWETKSTNIIHASTGDNLEVQHIIRYESKQNIEQEQSKRENLTKDKL